jgi:hypothetical protein
MTDKSNYTPEMVQQLIQRYAEVGTAGIDQLAQEFGKPVRSIRSKLVREGVYQPADKSASDREGPSKKQLLREIEAHGFQVDGFESATKPALHRLLGILKH